MRLDGPQKVTPQPRLQIREGMTVADVRKYGSDGQKLAASLFDTDTDKKDADGYYILKDGVYNKREAEYFNSYNFSVRDGIFTMYNRDSGHTTEIKYDNIEDLKKVLNAKTNEPDCMSMFENGKSKLYVGTAGVMGGKTTIDLTNHTVEFNGLTQGNVYTNGEKTTIKNSQLELVSSSSKEVDIQNVKWTGLFGDKKTWVTVDKDTKLKIDKQSKVDIERKEKTEKD